MANLALTLKVSERADLIGKRNLGIDPVELKKVDPVDLQPDEAALAARAQILWATVGHPLVRPRALKAGLGGDDQVLRVGRQSLGDQLLRDRGSVGVGGVDEIDAKLDGATQHGDGFLPIGGFAPDASAGEAHGAEAETIDRQFVADQERAAMRGGSIDGYHSRDDQALCLSESASIIRRVNLTIWPSRISINQAQVLR